MGNYKHFAIGELVYMCPQMYYTIQNGNQGIEEDDIGIVIEQNPYWCLVYFQNAARYETVMPEKLAWENQREWLESFRNNKQSDSTY